MQPPQQRAGGRCTLNGRVAPPCAMLHTSHTSQPITTAPGDRAQVVVDAGGSLAVTCSDDNTARVWDLDNATCLSVLKVS